MIRKSVMRRSERGGWKRVIDLAGRLLYFTHGFVAEAGQAIVSPTASTFLAATTIDHVDRAAMRRPTIVNSGHAAIRLNAFLIAVASVLGAFRNFSIA